MFAPFIVPVTASGLQGQQLLAQSSVFPTGTAVWGDSLTIGSSIPSYVLGGLVCRRSLCCGAGEVGRESKRGLLEVSPQLIGTLEEDELETVTDKAAITWSFLAFGAEGLLLQSTGKRARQCLHDFGKMGRVVQEPDLQVKVQNLSEELPKIEVDSKVRRCEQVETLRSPMIEDSADNVQNDQLFPGRGRGAAQDSEKESVQAMFHFLIDFALTKETGCA